MRGTLTLVFANVGRLRELRSTPIRSRRAASTRTSTGCGPRGARRPAPDAPSSRAPANCVRFYDTTDYLLDLHSMTDPCPPLALAGRQRKGVELAQARRGPRVRHHRRRPSGGTRLRDYALFDDPDDPRNALLVECGQHWEQAAPSSPGRRRCASCGISAWPTPAFLDAHLDAAAAGATDDRGHRRRDHRQPRFRLRAPRERHDDRRRRRNAARARRRAARSGRPTTTAC